MYTILYQRNHKGYICVSFNKHGSKACSSHIAREINVIDSVLSEITKFVDNIKNSNLYDNLKSQLDYEVIKHEQYISSYEEDLELLTKRKSLDSIASSSALDDINKIRNEDFHLKELTQDLLNRFIKRIDIQIDGTPIISFRLPNDLYI